MIQTIAYTSRATLIEGPNPLWLDSLVEHAEAKNKIHNISGVLSYKDGKIFQLIQGQPAQLQDLFEKISNDPRHQDLLILLDI